MAGGRVAPQWAAVWLPRAPLSSTLRRQSPRHHRPHACRSHLLRCLRERRYAQKVAHLTENRRRAQTTCSTVWCWRRMPTRRAGRRMAHLCGTRPAGGAHGRRGHTLRMQHELRLTQLPCQGGGGCACASAAWAACSSPPAPAHAWWKWVRVHSVMQVPQCGGLPTTGAPPH